MKTPPGSYEKRLREVMKNASGKLRHFGRRYSGEWPCAAGNRYAPPQMASLTISLPDDPASQIHAQRQQLPEFRSWATETRASRGQCLIATRPFVRFRLCPAVESIPAKVSGARVFRGTRMPVQTAFESLEG